MVKCLVKIFLTAAHCFNLEDFEANPDSKEFSVYLGRHNLSLVMERGSLHSDVREILIHREWSYELDKYDANIAILVLDVDVTFSKFIQVASLSRQHGSFLSSDRRFSLNDGIIVSYHKTNKIIKTFITFFADWLEGK